MTDRAWARWLAYLSMFGMAAISGVYVILRLLSEGIQGTGNDWKQGDWLINRDLVETRRGHLGSWILDIADLLAVSPLTTVVILQIICVIIIYVALLYVVIQVRQPMLLALIILSPGLFIIAWAADPQGSLRKETLAYLAILLCLSGLISHRIWIVFLGAVVFVLGVLGHEANILFLPLLVGVFWMFRDQINPRHQIGLGLVILCAIPAVLYGITYARVVDAGLVCAPLLDRGLDPGMCNGAIAWLEDDMATAMERIIAMNGNVRILGTMGLVYLGAFAPLVFALWHLAQRRQVIWLSVLAGLPFLPLYLVGLDWGRWLQLHVFSVLIIVLAGLGARRFTLAAVPHPLPVAGFLFAALLWAPTHLAGASWLWPRFLSYFLLGDVF